MAALDQFTPTAQAVIKIFAYPFRSAPTADLITWGVNTLQAGTPAGALLNTLFTLPVPQSPFTVYAPGSTSQAFVTSLVDNLTFATSIGSTIKAAWVDALLPMLATAPSRGDFVVQVALLIEGYTGAEPNLQALKAALSLRAEKAAAFALTPAGAAYDGKGFAQLLAPLTPPEPPSYTLTASAAEVDEGSPVTFTLKTKNVAAGTVFDYVIRGVDGQDLLNAGLSGTLTLNTQGEASLTLTPVADAKTEGRETLTLDVGTGTAVASVVIRDTSLDPPPPATYAVTAAAGNVDEGASIIFTLSTSQLASGTLVPFTLSGAGITAADIVGGVLTSSFTVDANGRATVAIALAADTLTEGAETLRLTLDGRGVFVDVTVNDTSPNPPPAATKDTVLVPDVLNNSSAHAPRTPAEGEVEIDTWLTYDFLDQSGNTPRRMSVADLKATGTVPGAVPVTTNKSADRGNVPQVSNQHLITYDLGLETDRVDYSLENGKVAAVVSRQATAGTTYVFVNDDATNDVFSNTTDRIDTLISVEEITAAAGAGLLDLTASGKDWVLTFSRGWDISPEIAATRDREIHRLLLTDPASGAVHPVTFLEYRDAGLSSDIRQPAILWSTIQGSDQAETLIFSTAEATDQRFNVLRGGANAVKFNNLTRSILVDVAATPWAASTLAADDTNATGVFTATVRFTNGDGSTLLSTATNVTSWNGADNAVAAGSLLIAGTQDAEDAISFDTVGLSKVVTLGQTVNGIDTVQIRLASGPAAYPLSLTGFERVQDNGTTDDLVIVYDMATASRGSPKLLDAVANDHDAVSLGDSSIGTAAVGGSATVIDLNVLNSATGLNFDFDVLDLSRLTQRTGALGTAATDDELVAGSLTTLSSANGFESVVLSTASLDKGAGFTLNLDSAAVLGIGSNVAYTGNTLSAGGLLYATSGQEGLYPAIDSGVTLTIVDSTPGAGGVLWGGNGADQLTGGKGDDVLRGGRGDDQLTGGSSTESWTFALGGIADTNPGQRFAISVNIDGTLLTLTEAAVADTNYADLNGAVVDGATSVDVGFALAALISANRSIINTGAGTGVLASAVYVAGNAQLQVSFVPGVDANDVVSVTYNAGIDTGTLAIGAGVNVNGSNGGADRYVFEKTAALNGVDTITDFSPSNDKLDLRAFLGTSIISAGATIPMQIGGTLAGLSNQIERVYGAANGVLTTSDFVTTSTAGKLVVADNTKFAVVVTADPTGNRGDAANTPMRIYLVENGATAGLGDLTVSLVGVVNSPTELTLAEMATAFS